MNHPFLKSNIGDTPVIVEAEFAASTNRLFQAWTTPEEIQQWFGAEEGGPESASVDLRVGGKWQFVFSEKEGRRDSLAGNYLEILPGEKLVFSWVHTRSFSDGTAHEVSPESKVTVTFESRGDISLTRILHESISTEGSRVNIGGGWSACLQKMLVLVE